jgi:carbonic anhydrase
MKTAQEALEALQAGNRRFVADVHSGATGTDRARRAELLAGQEPFAIILGCSDSRVPAEIVFDQGLGALFVIRVAGNIVAPSQVGSVEFAVERFGTRLVVVLGHTNCGAILATLEELERPGDSGWTNVGAIVSRIRPCVEPLREVAPPLAREVLLRAAMRANIRASVNQLRHGSRALEPAIHSGDVIVVGAEYSLETGVVTWLDIA